LLQNEPKIDFISHAIFSLWAILLGKAIFGAPRRIFLFWMVSWDFGTEGPIALLGLVLAVKNVLRAPIF